MRILALSGGGTGGLATAMYLRRLEESLRAPLYRRFDVVVGVSTGAIIATAIAGGMPMARLVERYEQEMPRIFKRSWWRFWAGYIGGPKYDKGVLREALVRMLPIQVLGEARTDLMLYANQIAPTLATKFWKSWRSDDALLPAAQCVAASCSAPTYFAPEEFLGGVFIDGGLALNDPGAPAIAEALRRNGESVVCLDLQVRQSPGISIRQARRKTSAVDWLPSLIGDALSFGADASEYIAATMLGRERYLKVDLGVNEPMDATGSEFNMRCSGYSELAWWHTQDDVEELLQRG